MMQQFTDVVSENELYATYTVQKVYALRDFVGESLLELRMFGDVDYYELLNELDKQCQNFEEIPTFEPNSGGGFLPAIDNNIKKETEKEKENEKKARVKILSKNLAKLTEMNSIAVKGDLIVDYSLRQLCNKVKIDKQLLQAVTLIPEPKLIKNIQENEKVWYAKVFEKVSNKLENIHEVYGQLSLEEKLCGIQSLFKKLLKYIWSMIINKFGLPKFQFDEVQDSESFFTKICECIAKTVKINGVDIPQINELNAMATKLSSIVNFVDIFMTAYTKHIAAVDFNKYQAILQTIKDISNDLNDTIAIINKNGSLNRLPTAHDISKYNDLQNLKTLIKNTTIYMTFLQKQESHAPLRINSYSRTQDRLNNYQKEVDNLNVNKTAYDICNVLSEQLMFLLQLLPRYVTNISILDIIKDSTEVQQMLGALEDNASQAKTFFAGIFSQMTSFLSSFFKTLNVQNIPNIPFEQVFVLCSFGVFNAMSIVDLFSGGLLQLINMGIILLHYVIVLSLPTISSASISRPTIEHVQREVINRTSELPKLVVPQNARITKNARGLPPIFKGGNDNGFKLPVIKGNAIQYVRKFSKEVVLPEVHIDNKINSIIQNVDILRSIKMSDVIEQQRVFKVKVDEYSVATIEGNTIQSSPQHQKLLEPYITDTTIPEMQNILTESYKPHDVLEANQELFGYIQTYLLDEAIIFSIANNSIIEKYAKYYNVRQVGGLKSLTKKQVMEIQQYLGSRTKEDLLSYCKIKSIAVSTKFTKDELIKHIIAIHKQKRKNKLADK